MIRHPPNSPLFPYPPPFRPPADALDGCRAMRLLQGLEHRAAETAGEHVVLHRDEERDDGRLAEEQIAVERLDEAGVHQDRKSTRLNSSHSQISYAVFCLKKK